MNTHGFAIATLAATGPSKPIAALTFRPGLNVVVGASNTGKTYAFQLLDFMLGTARTPKGIPEATGYTEGLLETMARDGAILTLKRSLSGGDALAYTVAIDAMSKAIASQTIRGTHDADNPETISGRFLGLSGLFGRRVRTNARGETRSLSFRDIAGLTLIDEVRIITESSPALSGQFSLSSVEENVFGLLLTGTDDASIVPQEKPENRKLRIQTELALLSSLIDQRDTSLRSYGITDDKIETQQVRIAEAITQATQSLSTTQAELNAAAEKRNCTWEELRKLDSRRLFITEQIKRFRLLRDYYESDHVRLESALEAGTVFAALPSGKCPVCGFAPLSHTETTDTSARLIEFKSACHAELAKIKTLSTDLETSMKSLQAEDDALAVLQGNLQTLLDELNQSMTGLLQRKIEDTSAQLQQLLDINKKVTEAAVVSSELSALRERYTSTEQNLSVKIPKLKLARKVETRTAADFCEVVASTLKAWGFPLTGTVSFDPRRFDIVIGNENRGSLGKGYRAVTHAAFTISLMRYCRQNNLPHPGIVVLDTPLNPFKGPDKDSSEKVNEEVQNSFYENLASDNSGDQVIVFENTEPPSQLRNTMNYVHFSGNPASGRCGFFPVT